MNLDISMHRLALRETDQLGVALMLVAKKRQEFEMRVQREQVAGSEAPEGTGLERTLSEMERQAIPVRHEMPPVNDSGVLVDKTA